MSGGGGGGGIHKFSDLNKANIITKHAVPSQFVCMGCGQCEVPVLKPS